MEASAMTERIVEEPIVVNAPGSPLYWTKLVDSSDDNRVGYALLCADKDLDICVLEKAYKGDLIDPIDNKVNEIKHRLEHPFYCVSCRISIVNDKGGIVKTRVV